MKVILSLSVLAGIAAGHEIVCYENIARADQVMAPWADTLLAHDIHPYPGYVESLATSGDKRAYVFGQVYAEKIEINDENDDGTGYANQDKGMSVYAWLEGLPPNSSGHFYVVNGVSCTEALASDFKSYYATDGSMNIRVKWEADSEGDYDGDYTEIIDGYSFASHDGHAVVVTLDPLAPYVNGDEAQPIGCVTFAPDMNACEEDYHCPGGNEFGWCTSGSNPCEQEMAFENIETDVDFENIDDDDEYSLQLRCTGFQEDFQGDYWTEWWFDYDNETQAMWEIIGTDETEWENQFEFGQWIQDLCWATMTTSQQDGAGLCFDSASWDAMFCGNWKKMGDTKCYSYFNKDRRDDVDDGIMTCQSMTGCDGCAEMAGCGWVSTTGTCVNKCPADAYDDCAVSVNQCVAETVEYMTGNCDLRCGDAGWNQEAQSRRLLQEPAATVVSEDTVENRQFFNGGGWGSPWAPYGTGAFGPPMPAAPPRSPSPCQPGNRLNACECSCNDDCVAKGNCCYDYEDRCVF